MAIPSLLFEAVLRALRSNSIVPVRHIPASHTATNAVIHSQTHDPDLIEPGSRWIRCRG